MLADAAHRVWLADIDAQPGGFVAVRLRHEAPWGEIYMIAVDPRAKGQGVGSALTVVVTEAAGTPTTQLAAARPHRPSGWRWSRPAATWAAAPRGVADVIADLAHASAIKLAA